MFLDTGFWKNGITRYCVVSLAISVSICMHAKFYRNARSNFGEMMAHYVLTALALCYIRLTCKCSSIDHPNSHITQFDMHVISWGLKLICPPHRKLKETIVYLQLEFSICLYFLARHVLFCSTQHLYKEIKSLLCLSVY